MVGRITGTNSSGLSGVFMGLLKNNSSSTMGLYGYRNGVKMFCLDENGILYLNGSANNPSTPDAENMLITNSTFRDCTFIGNLNGNADTATTANNYSTTGTIASAISDLQN